MGRLNRGWARALTTGVGWVGGGSEPCPLGRFLMAVMAHARGLRLAPPITLAPTCSYTAVSPTSGNSYLRLARFTAVGDVCDPSSVVFLASVRGGRPRVAA